jgi:hypothetical protein
MGKSPNEMGNCPFASPLVTPLNKRVKREKINWKGNLQILKNWEMI